MEAKKNMTAIPGVVIHQFWRLRCRVTSARVRSRIESEELVRPRGLTTDGSLRRFASMVGRPSLLPEPEPELTPSLGAFFDDDDPAPSSPTSEALPMLGESTAPEVATMATRCLYLTMYMSLMRRNRRTTIGGPTNTVYTACKSTPCSCERERERCCCSEGETC